MRPVTFRCPRGRLFSFKQKFPAEITPYPPGMSGSSACYRLKKTTDLPEPMYNAGSGLPRWQSLFCSTGILFPQISPLFYQFFSLLGIPGDRFFISVPVFYHSAVLDGLNICVRKINISWANSGMAASTSKVFHSPAFKRTV